MSTDTELAEARSTLKTEQAELRSQLAALGVGGEGLEYDANFADSSQVTAERGENEAMVARLRESLQDVERALRKMDEGHYGVCERCGQPIAAARLEAMPAVRMCIACASASKG